MKTQTFELFLTAIEALEAKVAVLEARATPGPRIPRAHDILATVLDATGYRDDWESGTLDVDEHVELLHLVRLEGRKWLRAEAAGVLDAIDALESKALFGAAKAKVSAFFGQAKRYIRELFVAGVLAVAGPAEMDAAELRALDAEVAAQHAYLDKFEQEVVEGNKPPDPAQPAAGDNLPVPTRPPEGGKPAEPSRPIDGNFVARAEKYGASVWGASQEILRAGAKAERHYKSERRLHRGKDRPCKDCRDEMAKGWQPIGTLRKIGDSECMMNCHCMFIYGLGDSRGDSPGDSRSKSLGFDSKAYTPCRDARGRFASCGGAPQGTRHPAPTGGETKPKPGSGGGKKPKKKPGKPKTPKKPAGPKEPTEKPKPAEKPKPTLKPEKPKPEPKPPEKKPKPSATAKHSVVDVPGVGPLQFVPARAARSQRMPTVWVDVPKLDAAFQRDSGFAIKPGGEGAIPGRMEGFKEFLEQAKDKGIAIEQSQVVVGKDGSASFVDGRHRFSVLRDMGVKQLPISVPKGQAKLVEKHFGAKPAGKPAEATRPEPGATRPPAAPGPGESWTVSPEQAKDWVKDSVFSVPLYHRTYEPAKADIEKNGINMNKANGVYGQGLYVSTKPEKSFGPATVEVALNIKNPLIGDMDTIQKLQASWPKAGEYILPAEVRAEALKRGYDAIVVHLDESYKGPSGHNWVVVIKPEAARFVKR